MFTLNKNPTDRELSQFGLAMLAGFGVIGALLWLVSAWRIGESAALSWSGSSAQIGTISLWAAGVAFFILTRTSLTAAKPVYLVWMTVALRIGIVMSTVLLTVLFVVLLPVFSLIVRSGDPLRRKLHSGKTYWEDYKPCEPTVERMKRLF